MMRCLLLACLLIVGMLNAQNYVPDGGFELTKGFNDTTRWFSPGAGSPDLTGTLHRRYGSAAAYRGSVAAGIILYDEDNQSYREYIACTLTAPLLKDSCYELSLWVRTSEGSYYRCDGFGVWLGAEKISQHGSSPIHTKPVWKHPAQEAVAPDDQWQKLVVPIKAKGGETNLVLGNFRNDAETSLQVNNRKALFRLSYLQIDEITLQPCFQSAETTNTQVDFQKTHTKKGSLVVPNVVTPNNDGFNDVFFIHDLQPYTGILIRNSKGEEVFKERSYRNNWDGNGCVSGKYSYELVLPDGNRIYGGFDLVRKYTAPKRPVQQKKRRRR